MGTSSMLGAKRDGAVRENVVDRATHTCIARQKRPTSINGREHRLPGHTKTLIRESERRSCKQEARRESSDRSFTLHKLRMDCIACIRCKSCDQYHDGSAQSIGQLSLCLYHHYIHKMSFTRWKQPTQARRCPQCSARQAWTCPPR